MQLLGVVGLVESRSVRLHIVLVLMKDRCMLCSKRTIGLDIILDAPEGTPWCHRLCLISFGPFGNSVSVDVR